MQGFRCPFTVREISHFALCNKGWLILALAPLWPQSRASHFRKVRRRYLLEATESNGRKSESVFDSVDNRRRRAVHRKFADAFCAIGAVNVAEFFKVDANGRKIGGSGHDVVGHLAVLHAPIFPNHFFV